MTSHTPLCDVTYCLSLDAWPHLLPEKVKFQNQTRPMHKEIHPRAEVDDEAAKHNVHPNLTHV